MEIYGGHVAPQHAITSPLSLGRVLWWYGEDTLWRPALELTPQAVAGLSSRFADLLAEPEKAELVWPGAPLADAHLVLGAIEHLEGRLRAALRRHRRGGPMPEALDRTEAERWRDPGLAAVMRLVDEATGDGDDREPWQRLRFAGRWAAG